MWLQTILLINTNIRKEDWARQKGIRTQFLSHHKKKKSILDILLDIRLSLPLQRFQLSLVMVQTVMVQTKTEQT